MDEETRQTLTSLNRQFYDDFAGSFSATRTQPQPGVRRVADQLPKKAHILDLGCGNGQFLNYLQKIGFSGSYTGVDASYKLLQDAASLYTTGQAFQADFLNLDLTQEEWTRLLAGKLFHMVTAFAVLHHIPGAAQRKTLLDEIWQLLWPGGLFMFSAWQFNNSPKLMRRILPWETIALQESKLDDGDTLLDWRAQSQLGQVGLRYVHLFSEAELEALRKECGFSLVERFYSDGKQGNLALYQVWQKGDKAFQ